jgi:Uncharacterised nucleotidyltransferase
VTSHLSAEQQCLALLARAELTGEEGRRIRGILAHPLGWNAIVQSAEDHGVVPTVVRNLRRLEWAGVPETTRRSLETSERLNAARNALIARGLRRILDRFGRDGIPVIPLKGVALADSLYGNVALRVCSDLDVLVPRSAVRSAIELLRADGYEEADRYRVQGEEIELLLRSGMEYCLLSPPAAMRYPVELHWDIAWRWRAGSALADAVWAEARRRSVLGVDAWTLGPEWELLYLTVHAAHHRWSTLKWLVDIDAVCRRGGLDWAGVEDRAQRFAVERALHLSLTACRTLLGTALPREFDRYSAPRRLRTLTTAPPPAGGWGEALSAIWLFRRPADKVLYLWRLLLQPALAEWRLVRFPSWLRFLYYPLRPLRLGIASGRMLLRGFGRLYP